MAADPELEAAVAAVVEPELRITLGAAGLVRDVRAKWGRVNVSVGLIAEDHPRATELRTSVEDALRSVAGDKEVHVQLEPLDNDGLAELASRLRALMPTGGASGNPLGHEEGRANSFSSPDSRTRVLGISSGKGGVGKSSVTVNLAVSLARTGASVALLDADVYGFSVPKMLGLTDKPMIAGDLIVPPVAHGVACLSMGFFVEEETPVIWRGPMLHKALEQFLVDAWWGNPDYLVIDMPPGTGDVALSMGQYLPRTEVFVVTTPQAAAQRVAQRSAFAARKLKLPLRGVIENMSWFTGHDGYRYELFGKGGGSSLASQLEIPLVGQIPLVPELREGGDVGLPITVSDPDGEASKAFAQLASAIAGMGPTRVYRSELRVR